MQDFNDFVKNGSGNGNMEDLLKSVAGKFDGKSSNDLLKAVFSEAQKRKKAGTLSNAELDKFKNALYPFLDDKKRKYLEKIIADLKEI